MAIEKQTLPSGLDLYFAAPLTSEPAPAVILFTEGLGLNSDMLEASVQKLADAGFFAVAPDIFHGDVFDGADRDAMIAKIRSIKDEEVLQETEQTLSFLRTRSDVAPDRVGGIGFCMGGRLAFLAHGTMPEVFKASAGFYGGGIAPDQDMLGRKPLLHLVPDMRGALFLGYGAEDAGITPAEHSRIIEALSSAKKTYSFNVYADAGHAFLSPSRPSYAPAAAALAWPQVFEFFHRYL